MEGSVTEPAKDTRAGPWQCRVKWLIGVDIGQANDPTALCAVESISYRLHPLWVHDYKAPDGSWVDPGAARIAAAKPKNLLNVRGLQRLPLGMGYMEQCGVIAQMLADQKIRDAEVLIDATGVGKPISDLFKRAGIKHAPVWITGGAEENSRGMGFTVPKLHLISRLQAALHAGELRIAKSLPEAVAFTRELQEFRVSWTEAGHMRFGARQGAHDDLVLAAALAVYGADRRTRLVSSVTPLRM